MNPSDSKKLEEARHEYYEGRGLISGIKYVKVMEAYIEEQDREIERQRRHRKWALEEAKALRKIANSYLERNDTLRDEKAETALADFKKVYSAHGTEAERQIDELQARVKELEAEKEKV